MPNVVSWLNKTDYSKLEQQCQILKESMYEYTQKAIKERLRKNESLATKANRWLYKDYKLHSEKTSVH